ncbi:zf-HC2 domain-containing protein [Actomonas aquatica]|uniref:HEAT repeat domain-containing protein n=1 Tax=Actomonas aquatica TaxID=2866162 RepID=A0ABZ1C3A4_9BACT|nr:zf-HC2 domain-containing protein [Opitutus sp. WL0086]WRQ85703.1 HEAT repeat domain-containing protein [Opitutus sp. WL0086]
MNCQRIQDHFIDYQAGTLPTHEAAAVRDHLKTCLTCQREWADLQQTLLTLDKLPVAEPSPRLRANFYAMLDEAQAEADAPSPFALARSRIDSFFAALLPSRPALQFALTVAVLIGGVWLGARVMPAPEPEVRVVTQPDPATQQELADLRQRVESMDRVVSTHLLTQPATQRLQSVIAALNENDANDRTLADLLNTLAFDPSVNLRLTALEALYAHVDRAPVRAGIINALPREPSPLVQVAMIDFVVASRDPDAAPALNRLAQNPSADAVVREAARRGLALL